MKENETCLVKFKYSARKTYKAYLAGQILSNDTG